VSRLCTPHIISDRLESSLGFSHYTHGAKKWFKEQSLRCALNGHISATPGNTARTD